jgi:hypothetical protein
MSDEPDIREYLKEQLREAYATAMWLEGHVCLRCYKFGILINDTDPKGYPWCSLCGKDPLFHGPLLMDRTFGFSGITKFSGLRAGDQRGIPHG